jgi:predicted lipoprotein
VTEYTNIEYCLLSYVPNVLSCEGVSIAAIFIDSTDPEEENCTMRFAEDWQTKVRLLDLDSDLDMLAALLTEIRDRLLSKPERRDMIRRMEDSFSNVVQISQRQKCPVAPRPETIEAFARELLGKTSKTRHLSRTQVPTC